MSDMTQFWNFVSKIGENWSQLGMYNYQQKKEEERLNREREAQAAREQSMWQKQYDVTRENQVSDLDKQLEAAKDLENLRTENDIKTDMAKKLNAANAEAALYSPELGQEMVGAAVSHDPAQMTRANIIQDGINKLNAGEEISDVHNQAFATLTPTAQTYISRLKGTSAQLAGTLREQETRNGYMQFLQQEGKITTNTYGALLTQIQKYDSDIDAIQKEPNFQMLIRLKSSGKQATPEIQALEASYMKRLGDLMAGKKTIQPFMDIVKKALNIPEPEQEQRPETGWGGPSPLSPLSEEPEGKSFGESTVSGLKAVPGKIVNMIAEGATSGPGFSLKALAQAMGPGAQPSSARAGQRPPQKPEQAVQMEKIIGDLEKKLQKRFSIPAGRSVLIAEGGNVLTKGPDGKMVIVPRDALKTIAKPEDFLWDQDAGKMFKLSLFLGDVQGDSALDEEDEIFTR